jgi:hypothetical protein
MFILYYDSYNLIHNALEFVILDNTVKEIDLHL